MINFPQQSLSTDDIRARFANARAWEERYRQLLLLSKALPKMDETLKTDANKLTGCESDVWLARLDENVWIDSNAKIIKGLLVMLLACINEGDNGEARFTQLLDELKLSQHLSQSRNNGLSAIWQALEQ